MKYEFNVKYGKNVLDIPITDKTRPAFVKSQMHDLWRSKVTIYNSIVSAVEGRYFGRHVVDMCQIQGGYVMKADGTVEQAANAKTVITKDISHYKSPKEYAELSADKRPDYFTVETGDFVVFGEVKDVVESAQEFAELQKKYANNGMKITAMTVSINDMSVDNITMTNG